MSHISAPIKAYTCTVNSIQNMYKKCTITSRQTLRQSWSNEYGDFVLSSLTECNKIIIEHNQHMYNRTCIL